MLGTSASDRLTLRITARQLCTWAIRPNPIMGYGIHRNVVMASLGACYSALGPVDNLLILLPRPLRHADQPRVAANPAAVPVCARRDASRHSHSRHRRRLRPRPMLRPLAQHLDLVFEPPRYASIPVGRGPQSLSRAKPGTTASLITRAVPAPFLSRPIAALARASRAPGFALLLLAVRRPISELWPQSSPCPASCHTNAA
jgi:hypothetical protein